MCVRSGLEQTELHGLLRVASATDRSVYALSLVPLGYQEVDYGILHPADRSTVAVLSKELPVDVLGPSQSCNRLRRLDNHRQRGLDNIKLARAYVSQSLS